MVQIWVELVIGALVELVTMPPCQGGGHGFKSHTFRNLFQMVRIIIAGSRDFSDYRLLKAKLDSLIRDKEKTEIVSGTARGADLLGEKYAKENEIEIKRFPADWDKYGKSAGYRRNEEMAKYANACICFWDGKSRGTKSMIDLAEKYNLKTIVIRYGEA